MLLIAILHSSGYKVFNCNMCSAYYFKNFQLTILALLFPRSAKLELRVQSLMKLKTSTSHFLLWEMLFLL